jgi:pyridoxamine 5'-phosphate oxidase
LRSGSVRRDTALALRRDRWRHPASERDDARDRRRTRPARRFVFHTSYDGRKARDIAAHPYAALVLWWEPLHRQIRVEGRVEKLPAAESDAYFATRPRGSQLGAIASPQSDVIGSRQELEAKVASLQLHYGETVPPRPDNWGGYRVVPDMVELWQGQPSRLHDRVRYTLFAGSWVRERLAP